MGPLERLVEKLDALLARTDVDEESQDLHRALRRMADVAADLRVPLVVRR